MTRQPLFWGIHARPPKLMNAGLMAMPFVLTVALYCYAIYAGHQEGGSSALAPSFAEMWKALVKAMTVEDLRSGELVFWTDTVSSLKRILSALSLSVSVGALSGALIGYYPGFRALFLRYIVVISTIPAITLLPVIFVLFGNREGGKIAMIVIGTMPFITRDIALEVSKIPIQRTVLAVTLGARTTGLLRHVVFPQAWPRLIESLRAQLGPAWIYLIVAESAAARSGIGYRIFQSRRFFNMDLIYPYVAWVTILGVAMDFMLIGLMYWTARWYVDSKLKN